MIPEMFLHAAREAPDDTLHRLALADWFEEHGQDDRAAFVRAQLRALAAQDGSEEQAAAEDEADDLLALHEDEWAGRVGELALEWEWRGGCIERLTVWGDTLLRHGDEIFAAAPIRSIRLLAESGDFERLAERGWLRFVERIDLGARSPDDGPHTAIFYRDAALQSLLRSPHLSRLRSLRLTGLGIEGPLLQTLAQTGLWGRLESLNLSANRAIGDRLARKLASIPAPRLRKLGLLETNVTAGGLRALLSADAWPEMRELKLNLALLNDRLGDRGIVEQFRELPLSSQLTTITMQSAALSNAELDELLSLPRRHPLKELRLVHCRLTSEDARVIAGSPAMRHLERLTLTHNRLRDAGAIALAGSAYLSRLTRLELASNDIGGPGHRAIGWSQALAGLRRLDLSGNFFGVTGAEALAKGERPRRLTALSLADANVGPEAAELLAGSPALGRLRYLGLNSNRVTDEGVAVLAGSPVLRRLRELRLDSTGLDSPGAEALLASPHLGRVRRLGVRNSMVTPNERERLRGRFGAGTMF